MYVCVLLNGDKRDNCAATWNVDTDNVFLTVSKKESRCILDCEYKRIEMTVSVTVICPMELGSEATHESTILVSQTAVHVSREQ